jgi:hypothetical protein
MRLALWLPSWLQFTKTGLRSWSVSLVRGKGKSLTQEMQTAHTTADCACCVMLCCAVLGCAAQLLPFCGAFTAQVIHQLLTTGTCDQLERYRVNQVGGSSSS